MYACLCVLDKKRRLRRSIIQDQPGLPIFTNINKVKKGYKLDDQQKSTVYKLAMH